MLIKLQCVQMERLQNLAPTLSCWQEKVCMLLLLGHRGLHSIDFLFSICWDLGECSRTKELKNDPYARIAFHVRCWKSCSWGVIRTWLCSILAWDVQNEIVEGRATICSMIFVSSFSIVTQVVQTWNLLCEIISGSFNLMSTDVLHNIFYMSQFKRYNSVYLWLFIMSNHACSY